VHSVLQIVLAITMRLAFIMTIVMSNSNIEQDLTSLKAKLEAEIESDLKQFEALKKKIQKNEDLLRAIKASLGGSRNEGDNAAYGTKLEIIQAAIGRIPKQQFTQNEVEAEIKRSNPEMDVNRDRIRAALWTMASKENGIKQISKGNNKQPALYEKIAGIVKTKRTTEQDKIQTLRNAESGVVGFTATPHISPIMLEESVRAKSGRVEDLAKRLKTDDATIKSLLDPASKVVMGHAGWLKLRNE
jgi:hypothetical protein